MANDDVKMTIRIHNFCACAWPDHAKMWSCLIFSFLLPESEWWRSWIFFPFSSLWGFVWWPTFYVFVVKMLGKNDHELDNYMKWNYPGLLLLWLIVSLWLYCVSVPNVPARSCWELGSSIRAGPFVVFVSVIFNLNVWQVPESICLVCTQEYIYLFISTLVFSCYFIDRFEWTADESCGGSGSSDSQGVRSSDSDEISTTYSSSSISCNSCRTLSSSFSLANCRFSVSPNVAWYCSRSCCFSSGENRDKLCSLCREILYV